MSTVSPVKRFVAGNVFSWNVSLMVFLLVDARGIIEGFHLMIRRKSGTDLDLWLDRARASLVSSFAIGVAKDIAAVRAANVSQWSNGQIEGQITKLKLAKRSMYGRGKLDLLQARFIGAT